MSKEDIIESEGVVSEILSGAMFRVMLNNGLEVLCQASGKMRMNHIKILLGDRVRVELSQYDLTKGRIVYRSK